MKKKILKYHLEIFTAIVLLMTVINALLFKHLSDARKIITLFLLLGVLHEWEEKRFPGGFFDLMAKKFGMQFSQDTLGKAGCIVVSYWLLITLIPFVCVIELFKRQRVHTDLVAAPTELSKNIRR